MYSIKGPENKTYTVGFKLFTKEPLWVLSPDTTRLKAAIDAFNLQQFLEGSKVEAELQKHIKGRTVSDTFVLETLGTPTWRNKFADVNEVKETLGYDFLRLNLIFTNGILSAYRRYN